jgi:hypothetical protein
MRKKIYEDEKSVIACPKGEAIQSGIAMLAWVASSARCASSQ